MKRSYIILIQLVFCAFIAIPIHTQDLNEQPLVINGVAVPSDYPVFSPSIHKETAPGYVFLNNWFGSPYIMILENDGTPYFYRRVRERSRDFKVQPNNLLSRRIRAGINGYVVMDSKYRTVDTYLCKNGYGTDEHDLHMLPNGNVLMIALEYRQMDLSSVIPGGRTEATVIGNHIQELDTNHQVVFEWKCWDHFQIEDSYSEDLTNETVDYVHMNSVAADYDGHILISSRHLSECTKIDRQTGEIIWRLGGKNNQFEYTNETDSISYQHDFRPVPGNPDHYTIFDNGNQKDPPYTRVVEYKLDPVNMTAEKIWEYRHDPDRYTGWMGNAQRLKNGNTFINWADTYLPKATEVTPGGEVVYEADFEAPTPTYRSFRFEWDGMMPEPYLIAEPFPDKIRLIFNKFGDPSVDYYNIYGSTDPGLLEWIDSTANTWIDLKELEDSVYYYLEVTAVDTSGTESPPSERETVYVRNIEPGENLIRNGDFSAGDNYWVHMNDGGGSSVLSTADRILHIDIKNGGSQSWHVQVFQTDIPIIQTNSYILEFDAKADLPRTVEIKVGQSKRPWTNYSKTGFIYVTQEFQRFKLPFIMADPTDLNSRLVINAGNSNIDLEFRDIRLSQKVVSAGKRQPEDFFEKISCYPNPAGQSITVSYHLKHPSEVQITLLNLTGQTAVPLYQGSQVAGKQEMLIQTGHLPEGIFLLQLTDDGRSVYKKIVIRH